MTIGKPTKTNDTNPRLPVEAIVHENEYDVEKYDALLTQYDKELGEYYLNRNANQKVTNWTKQMADYLVNQQRPFIKDFLASQGFTWK